jgi:hypothetical protein
MLLFSKLKFSNCPSSPFHQPAVYNRTTLNESLHHRQSLQLQTHPRKWCSSSNKDDDNDYGPTDFDETQDLAELVKMNAFGRLPTEPEMNKLSNDQFVRKSSN